MSSEFQALQCPCGCELNAENRLERLYRALLLYFSDELNNESNIVGMVDCASSNSKLKFISKELPDRVHKRILRLRTVLGFDFLVVYDGDWTFDVNKKGGLIYEPIQRMAEHTDIRH